MTITLEELARRVFALERQVHSLCQRGLPQPVAETPAERGARLLRGARSNQPAISAAVVRAFTRMGITCPPIGAERVQEMIAAGGFKPEDNEFSRGIVAMREE
jgi:hypothetical protein